MSAFKMTWWGLAVAGFLALACKREDAKPAAAAAPATPVPAATPPPAAQGEDWNDAQIAWKSYDEGLAAAATEKKPVCLVFFTTWCPHCKNFSRVFKDPRVVEASKSLVMVRLDKDKNPEISRKFAPDGEYIPRTYFLASNGTLAPSIHAPRTQFQYFYDESNPASILAGLEAAKKELN